MLVAKCKSRFPTTTSDASTGNSEGALFSLPPDQDPPIPAPFQGCKQMKSRCSVKCLHFAVDTSIEIQRIPNIETCFFLKLKSQAAKEQLLNAADVLMIFDVSKTFLVVYTMEYTDSTYPDPLL